MADQGRTVVQAAHAHPLSWPVVAAAFTSHARAALPALPEPVQALGIDEIHRGRRDHKGNRERELRNRLTRSAARMRGTHVDALLDELSNLPTVIGAPITDA